MPHPITWWVRLVRLDDDHADFASPEHHEATVRLPAAEWRMIGSPVEVKFTPTAANRAGGDS